MSYKRSKVFSIFKKKKIRYLLLNNKSQITVVFFHGFMSDMTGKKPTENRPHKESDFKSMPNMALRKLLREKGLPTTGVKSKLIARLVDSVKDDQKIKEKSSDNNNKKTEIKRKTAKKTTTKKVTKPKNEEKTTTIECPDCSATMEIPDVSGMQEVECSECGIKGEIEL